MDALDTAFADGSVACVVTSFLIDLIPEPRKLASEIHRILCDDGVWINYGPSGLAGQSERAAR
jgi:ubiquinone/menaquinone biosynthesis C-methylase UbiE